MRRQHLDVLGVTETHSRRQGWQFAPSYTALESGAVDVEGNAVLVPEEAELTLRPEGATDTEFVVVVQSGEVDRLRLVLVYARPGEAGPAVYRRWTDIVTSSALPVVVMGTLTRTPCETHSSAGWSRSGGIKFSRPGGRGHGVEREHMRGNTR